MKTTLVFALCALICGAGCTRRNFDSVCQLAKDILAEPRIAAGDRFDRFSEQVDHFASGASLDAARAAIAAPKGKRTVAFMKVAKESAPGWQCVALEPVLEPRATP